jgi:hypothetical protein
VSWLRTSDLRWAGAVLLYDELGDYLIRRLSLHDDRHVRLGRRLLSKASGVSEDHESTPRCAPDRADIGEFP